MKPGDLLHVGLMILLTLANLLVLYAFSRRWLNVDSSFAILIATTIAQVLLGVWAVVKRSRLWGAAVAMVIFNILALTPFFILSMIRYTNTFGT